MKKNFTLNSSWIIYIKTALYTILTIVLAGWVSDGLNEDIIFRVIVRSLYPEAVLSYEHPLQSIEHFHMVYSISYWFCTNVNCIHKSIAPH